MFEHLKCLFYMFGSCLKKWITYIHVWWCGTSEDVVLVVLVSLSSHFNKTCESFSHHKLMHQIFIILQEKHKQQKLNVFTEYPEETESTQTQHRLWRKKKIYWCISKLKHPTEIEKITLHNVTKNIVFYCNTLSGWPKRIAERPSCAFINGLDFKLTQPKLKLMNSYLSNAMSAFSLRSLKVPPPTPTHVALFCKLSVHQVLGTS